MAIRHMRNGQRVNATLGKAINVFFNIVGRKNITHGNVQGALEDIDDKVDELNSKLSRMVEIKQKTITGTTNASGFTGSLGSTAHFRLVNATNNTPNSAISVEQYILEGYVYLRLVVYSTKEPKANTNYNITVDYFEI